MRPEARRALIAGSVGNFIEWYEFGAYGYMATVIAADFFSGDGTTGGAEGLIRTYASFALAFFFRPVGAALFGRVGDRFGRRPALVLALALMTGATTLIGLLPTYATLGAAAPWLLTGARVLQGLSAGGEFGGAVSLLTENAPPGRRGLYGAWQSCTVALGLLAGAGLAAALAMTLGPDALTAWGWRVPFLLAFPLGAVALWLRLTLEESPEFRRIATAGPAADGVPEELPRPLWAVALGIGRIMGWAAAGYTFLVVLPTYLQHTVGTTFQQALTATALANLGFAAAVLPAGALSDRVGRRPVMAAGAALVVLLAFPLLTLLQNATAPTAAKAAALLLAGAAVGAMAGPGPAMLAEMFPPRVRCTGLGLSYALANAVFSGCAGLIVTELAERTGNTGIPAYYAAVTCAISAVALLAPGGGGAPARG
ncbi:MFS transporter [Streptomyces hesseae]|uniref:MFS transporter n=1 Tax=Streptomyces hesseae TaxID=3075519 RepID=A0ABU2SFJ0_9ACTN|nr:MFS transporter [Streptomyces sp. DSM 40473]MDT0447637.1 MFS transporter [Streptomyces sp. DSM 40473]